MSFSFHPDADGEFLEAIDYYEKTITLYFFKKLHKFLYFIV